jgi:hypothetical protein
MDCLALIELFRRNSRVFSAALKTTLETRMEKEKKKEYKLVRSPEERLTYFKMKYLSDEAYKIFCRLLPEKEFLPFNKIKLNQTAKLNVVRERFPTFELLKDAHHIKGVKLDLEKALYSGIFKILLTTSIKDIQFFAIDIIWDGTVVSRKETHTIVSFRFIGFPFSCDQSPSSLQKYAVIYAPENDEFTKRTISGLLKELSTVKAFSFGPLGNKSVISLFTADMKAVGDAMELGEGEFCFWCGVVHKVLCGKERLFVTCIGNVEFLSFLKKKTEGRLIVHRSVFIFLLLPKSFDRKPPKKKASNSFRNTPRHSQNMRVGHQAALSLGSRE